MTINDQTTVARTARFRSLDSLRGLAALIVVFLHLYLTVPDAARHISVEVVLTMLGRFAVILFFVLSGFVLAMPYFAKTNQAYLPYLVRRICRLYPPYAFAVLVSAILCTWIGGFPLRGFSIWFREGWSSPVSAHDLASHLLVTGISLSSIRLDVPLWSLIVEMRVSVIFPLLVLFVRRLNWLGVLLAVLAALVSRVIAAKIGDTSQFTSETWLGAILLTVRYVPFFVLGVIAAAKLERHKNIIFHLPNYFHVAMQISFIAIVGLLCVRQRENTWYADIAYACAALYLINCCVAFPRFSKRLTGRACLWLGDVSYSLYLIHVPILLAAFYLLNGKIPFEAISLIVLLLALVGAQLMHQLVEQPSMALGRKLAKRQAARIPAVPQPTS